MTTTRGLIVMLGSLIIGIAAIILVPDLALAAIVGSLPVLVVGAIAAEVYLTRVYRRQPIPRSRFFRMLVTAQAGKIILGVWVGYLVIGRIGDRTGWYLLPTPPTNISSPISGLLVAVVIALPIVYAVEIYRVRRRAGPGLATSDPERSLDPARADDLDRET